MEDSRRELDVEERINKIQEDLKFCESILNREARIELARRILEDLSEEIQSIKRSELSEQLRAQLNEMETKIRILYHRANALLSLQEQREKHNSTT